MRAEKYCKLSLTGIKAVPGSIYMVFSNKIRAHFISNLSWLGTSSSSSKALLGICIMPKSSH